MMEPKRKKHNEKIVDEMKLHNITPQLIMKMWEAEREETAARIDQIFDELIVAIKKRNKQ